MKFIGICGPARHGKNTVAQILEEEFGYETVAFADKLREVALAIDPFVYVEKGLKEPLFMSLTDAVGQLGWELAKESPNVRRTLQRVGTEAGRSLISDSLWTTLHWKVAEGLHRVAIPDVRFENELKYVCEHGGAMIRVFDPRKVENGVGTAHASEQHCMLLDVDVEILNDGTIEDLRAKVIKAVANLSLDRLALKFKTA